MTGAQIISFATGEIIDGDEPIEDVPQIVEPACFGAMIDLLHKLLTLTRQGRLESLVVIAQDPTTGYFLNEVLIDQEIDRSELFGYIGILETLKLEFTEQATMAPTINVLGNIVDPFEEQEE